MANTDTPIGMVPYGNVRLTRVAEAGSAIYPGDPITVADDGQIDITTATTGTIDGVALTYASAAGQKVLVSCHPEQIYEIQGDETEITAQTIIGYVADIVATAGNSTYKVSRVELDSSSAAATGNLQLVILGLSQGVNNAFGTNAKVLVRINNHQAFGKDAFAGI